MAHNGIWASVFMVSVISRKLKKTIERERETKSYEVGLLV